MWLKVRMMVGGRESRVDGLSKLTKIEELRKRIQEEMEEREDGELDPAKQRLFFKGKELVDQHSLFDYGVGLNDCLQLLLRKPPKPSDDDGDGDDNNNDKNEQDNNNGSRKDGTGSGGGDLEAETPGADVEEKDVESATYKKGELVDVLDTTTGAWFEGEIHSVRGFPVPSNSNAASSSTASSSSTAAPSSSSSSSSGAPVAPSYEDDGFSYVIKFESYTDLETVSSTRLRPIARTAVEVKKMKPDTVYLVNANVESPDERGFWYDFLVKPEPSTSKQKKPRLTASSTQEGWLFVGADRAPFETKLSIREKVFQLDRAGDVKRIFRDGREESPPVPEPRGVGPECDECKGNAKRKCKKCGCAKCGGKGEPEKTIVCDECEDGFHLWCLDPPLDAMPQDDEWYCPGCRNDRSEIVQAGEGLKASKRKASMPSAKGDTKRDWGKGMATQGVAGKCTIVGNDHFGPIPGVEVGTCWRFRVDCCASGVHRPPVAGIAGKGSIGAQSVVLSGGYEDDEDEGETFTYTGAGGRDLSGNKRTAGQSCDQTLTKTNLALAMNCAAKVNEKGADAGSDWRKGKDLRVVRNYKGAKHSNYAPEEGNRYDGIYKVVKYWKDKGKSGFYVWRYQMKRDDKTPAPWTKEGKKRIEELGISEMIVPEGYYEALKEKEEKKQKEKEEKAKESRKSRGGGGGGGGDDDEVEMSVSEDDDDDGGKSSKKEKASSSKKRKRRLSSSDDENSSDGDKENIPSKKKRAKSSSSAASSSSSSSAVVVVAFRPPKDIADLIDADVINAKLWAEVKAQGENGRPKFIEKLKDTFNCVCCQDVVAEPVTTPCAHNSCRDCLKRSFASGVKSCPVCRGDLVDDDFKKVNQGLTTVLKTLLPGYDGGR